jgi:hypothetical protein
MRDILQIRFHNAEKRASCVDRDVVRRPIAAPRRGISRNALGSFAQDPENSSVKSSLDHLAYLLP